MEYRTRGIVLSSLDAGEADKIIILFSEDKGKILLRAQGVRKDKAKLKSHVQPIYFSDVQFVPTRSTNSAQFRLIGAEALEVFDGIRKNLEAFYWARVTAGALSSILVEREREHEVFSSLVSYLKVLNQIPDQSRYLTFMFLLKAVSFLGYDPSREECGVCGQQSKLEYLNGSCGLMCKKCSWQFKDAFYFPADLAKLKKHLEFEDLLYYPAADSSKMLEATKGIFHFISWHCHSELPAFSVVSEFAKMA